MASKLTRWDREPPSEADIRARFEADGLTPHSWGNAPGDRYGWHSHSYDKVLYCARGSIVFHTRDADHELHPGDRLEIEAGTEHSATVGPDGVTCWEAARG